MNDARSLGYDTSHGEYSRGCNIWNDDFPQKSTLQQYKRELDEMNKLVQEFHIPDETRKNIRHDPSLCKALKLHPAGLSGIFTSGSLSSTERHGLLEPILPPMRHPRFCDDGRYLMSMDYLVHDFEAMCKNLVPDSRIVLFDLGASLSFHQDSGDQPILSLIRTYEKFGFYFDHIYAFEKSVSPPEKVFEALPEDLMASYHWINVGVETEERSKLNPLKHILKQFSADDFIVVKLDVDNPSVELPLVEQILTDASIAELIDQFYFEHHVLLEELRGAWGEGVQGSVLSSLELFQTLRSRGVAAHFWV